ncbi:dTDP-4-dehydrorhamnose 3,5-epimerase family protein [bacterium]|nr:dTDP-4-dehydrorhamnose 3,5-epimerase family protein [candidate division CSSED10-310 bacterium]
MDLIDGVKTRQLKRIPDERGYLMEMFRSDWPEFSEFGQVYITAVYSGVVKGWHYHELQDDTFVCVSGMAKVVLYDARKESPTFGRINEFFIGVLNPMLVQIPKGVYHGFKGISEEVTLIVNIPTKTYNYAKPDEYRLPAHTDQIPYDWTRHDG